jgi:hypothetical protein
MIMKRNFKRLYNIYLYPEQEDSMFIENVYAYTLD